MPTWGRGGRGKAKHVTRKRDLQVPAWKSRGMEDIIIEVREIKHREAKARATRASPPAIVVLAYTKCNRSYVRPNEVAIEETAGMSVFDLG